jgi:hypothetical protein
LEKVGWLLQHGDVSGQEVTERLAEYLAAELDLPAVAAAEKTSLAEMLYRLTRPEASLIECLQSWWRKGHKR